MRQVCILNNNIYTFDNASYKKIKEKNLLEDFKDNIKICYFNSKHYYVDGCNTYKKFLTIIRQICSYNKIEYNVKITYNKSKYSPIYSINMS